MKRIWKPVQGYEDTYIVSNYGDVIRLQGYDARGHLRRARVRKAVKNGDGYLSVGLHKDGVETKFLVHRLVADAFLKKSRDKPEINHKDEDPSNNRADNLEWCTRQYNVNYGNCQSNRIITRYGRKRICVEKI